MSEATDDNKPGQASAEQAADLAALEAAANVGNGPAPAHGAAEAAPNEPPPPSEGGMAAAGLLVGLLRPVAPIVAPGLREAPPELWEPIVPALARVFDLHGLSDTELMRNPYFGLAIAGMPLAVVAYVNHPRKADAPPQLQAPPAPVSITDPPAAAAPPPAAVVTFGAPVPGAGEGGQ